LAKRTWTLDSRDYSSEDEFRNAVAQELGAFEHIGQRIGLALIASPIRERINGDFVTTGWAFRTETVPTVREAPAAEVIQLPVEESEEPAIPAAEGASF